MLTLHPGWLRGLLTVFPAGSLQGLKHRLLDRKVKPVFLLPEAAAWGLGKNAGPGITPHHHLLIL